MGFNIGSFLTGVGRGALAFSTFGQSEAAIRAGQYFLKDADTVNAHGDVESEGMKDALGAMDPAKAAFMFANWLTGGKPKPIDPSLSLARSAAMAGVEAKAGAGRGIGGLFGLGNILGSAQPSAPMQAGVPYSVPPIPNIFKPAPLPGQPGKSGPSGGVPR